MDLLGNVYLAQINIVCSRYPWLFDLTRICLFITNKYLFSKREYISDILNVSFQKPNLFWTKLFN